MDIKNLNDLPAFTTKDGSEIRELLAPAWLCETQGAREAFGFEAAIPLPHGLRQTAEWYRQNRWL